MSDAQRKLQDALARQAESYEDRQAREAQERAEAEGFFEQIIVPGFQAAADEINRQGAGNTRSGDPPPLAEVGEIRRLHDWLSVELVVRRGGRSEFWFLGIARMRGLPVQWLFRRSPRVKNDETITSEGTDRELKWNVSAAENPEQIRDDLVSRYAEVLEVIDRQRRR